ncbi:MAG: nucleotidyltransferase domain-containing protein [Candidatus Aenigmatarchaeota archaeon]
MERTEYLEKVKKLLKEMKKIVNQHVNAKIYVFGSIVKGNFSIGLSDVDIAIVSDEFKNREKKLEVYDILFSKYFDYPFEFHLLTEKQWNFYLRFIKKDFIEI